MTFVEGAGRSSRPGSAVARAKATVKQNDFSRGAIRPEYLESDDDPVRQRSYADGINVRPVARRGLKRRMGTLITSELTGTGIQGGVFQVEPEDGEVFHLVFVNGGLEIYDSTGSLDTSFGSMPWTTTAPWVAPAGRNIYIGGDHATYVLQFDAASWTLGAMSFQSLPSGALAQPYYNFEPGVWLTPSARNGSITITASSGIFTSDHVGTRIRWHEKEISITGYTSSTVVSGTVIEALPFSFDLTLGSADGFEVGEVVVGKTSEWQGLVSTVNTGTGVLGVVSLSGYEGPTVGETLVGPNTRSAISAKAFHGSPLASSYWTEQVVSEMRGYPKSGAIVNGRLFLCDFDAEPDLVCASSIRTLNDFETGLDDDDGIVRKVGDAGFRVRHVINAGDVVFLTDNGSFYINARDNQEITPSNFAASKFDSRAAGPARPLFVDSAVIYTSGDDILAAVLTGNVYLNWTTIVASDGYDGMFGSVNSFCAPSPTVNNEQRAILMVTDEGNVIALYQNNRFEDFGMFKWDFDALTNTYRGTDTCTVLGASSIGETYWIVTKREMETGGSSAYNLEKMVDGHYLDFTTAYTGGASVSLTDPYDGATVTLMHDERYIGTFDDLSEAETAIANYTTGADIHVGLAWEPYFEPWPIELIESPRLGMIRARTIRIAVSVRSTTSMYVRRNGITSVVEAYSFGDDLGDPPPQKTKVLRFPVLGNRDHPEIVIGQKAPGPFEVLAYTAEVQG